MATAKAIDLRSDTVTRPSSAMRRAIAAAEVGDDVLDGDPTTRTLEGRIAALLGMPAALFFPSGTQANQTAIWIHTQSGTEILLEENCHLLHYEKAALAALSGVQIRPVRTPDGILTAELVRDAWRNPSPHLPEVTALAAENTHNAAGGRVMPLSVWDGLVAEARAWSVPVHLDGARLWNAAVALEVSPARVAKGADSVMVSLSKGLGCPVGSCLAGDQAFIDAAREVRRRLGGGMRQTGLLAAAGLYALDHHLPHLAKDHAKAQLLAKRLDGHSGVRPIPPETNIVMLDLLAPDSSAASVVDRLESAGVLVVPFGHRRLRAVTHLDVSEADVTRAANILAEVLGER
jgi:threonine aldolase